jgi:5S rRNA maturation endonuclease (ribonuclease M5)
VDLLPERFRHIILLLDGDQTGRKATIVIAQQLRPHCHVRVFCYQMVSNRISCRRKTSETSCSHPPNDD